MKKPPLPESQAQEVLYELLTRLFIDRRSMMLSSGVLNLTAIISELRTKGVDIISNKIEVLNKYGRKVIYVQYNLANKQEANKVYLDMKQAQAERLPYFAPKHAN